jgi:hypothetical protein
MAVLTTALDADGRITTEDPCLACGYCLRGVRPSDRCPECGAPVAWSLPMPGQAHALAPQLARLERGAAWLTVLLPWAWLPLTWPLTTIAIWLLTEPGMRRHAAWWIRAKTLAIVLVATGAIFVGEAGEPLWTALSPAPLIGVAFGAGLALAIFGGLACRHAALVCERKRLARMGMIPWIVGLGMATLSGLIIGLATVSQSDVPPGMVATLIAFIMLAALPLATIAAALVWNAVWRAGVIAGAGRVVFSPAPARTLRDEPEGGRDEP